MTSNSTRILSLEGGTVRFSPDGDRSVVGEQATSFTFTQRTRTDITYTPEGLEWEDVVAWWRRVKNRWRLRRQ